MIELLESALKASRAGQTVAMATVVAAHGSTPRATGAKMLVYPDGRIEGTVGGGEMERQVIEAAKNAIQTRRSQLIHYTYNEADSNGVGICGGQNDVYIEVMAPPLELLIVGGGHVGLAVSKLAAFIGLDTVIFDNRPEFANAERFPQAHKIFATEDLAGELSRYEIGAQTYILIVTRGHQDDAAALAAILPSNPAYIGMIGSRRKGIKVRETMLQQGFTQEQLDRVHSPVGLDIGAETPEEIAVSILAEIIAVIKKNQPAVSGA